MVLCGARAALAVCPERWVTAPSFSKGVERDGIRRESGARNVDNILTNTLLPEISRQILGKMAERQGLGPIHVSVGENGSFVYA